MDAGSHTEWLTLSERLANIVLNPDHPIGQEFNNFTTLVLNKCHAIRTTVEGLIRKTPELDDRYMDYYVVGEKDVKVDKVVLEDMRIDILLHLWKISDHLTEYFENNEHLFVNKVRLSYEKCFFHRTGEEVMKLYRLVHSTSMKTIENRAKRVREYPICKLGLQMKDEWWLALLDNDDTSDVNEILSNDPDDNDDKSAVDDMGKMNPGNNTLEYFQRNLKFSKEKVLSKSLSNLNAVFDGHDYRREVDEMTKLIEARNRSVTVSIVEEEHVHQDTSKDGNKIVDNVEVRCISNKANSMMEIERASSNAKPVSSRRGSSKDTFRLHFGQTIKSIRNIFGSHGPLAKMQCLTSALKLLVDKVVELRMRDLDTDKCDRAKIAVSADDLLPLIVLMLLKLEPSEVGYLFVELIYISDLMAEFLAAGCHSYALTEFQIAFRVLDQTCEELEL